MRIILRILGYQFILLRMLSIYNEECLNIYSLYFGTDAKEEMSKSWALNVICAMCVRYLRAWFNETKNFMPYAVPLISRKQANHITDCYFC